MRTGLLAGLAIALAGFGALGLVAQSAAVPPAGTAAETPPSDLVQVQATEATPFNLFALEGFGQFRVFNFDQAYTDQFGIAVPTPFQIAVPLNDALDLVSDGAPDAGFAKFTWVAEVEGERRFVENLAIFAADWGMGTSPLERRAEILALIRDRLFAQATAQHGGGSLTAWGEMEIGGVPAVQAIGTYADAEWGPMLLRIVAVPNPAAGPSYFTINNVSLNMVPIVHVDQVRSSLGGQAVMSFRYLSGG